MSKPLVSASIAAPGFLGLNTQESSITLEDGYALEAINCIIDKYGRLGSRKGWELIASGVGQGVYSEQSTNIFNKPVLNRSSEIASIRRDIEDNRIEITFSANHGLTVGTTIEVYDFKASAGSLHHEPDDLNKPTADTGYTFNVASTTLLTSVDPLANLDGSSSTRNTISEALFEVPAIPLIDGAHRLVNASGSDDIYVWGTQTDVKEPPGYFGFYFLSSSNQLSPMATDTSNADSLKEFQAVSLNNRVYLFQESHYPMRIGGWGNPGVKYLGDVEDAFASYIDPDTGVAFANEAAYRAHIPQADVALSAYGRVWCARTANDKLTVYWTDLLDGSKWVGGSSGSLDLAAILINGGDEITGLGAQNGQLIVFLRNSIVIFADNTGSASFDPAQLRLVEVINRVGCVARDSIQNTGSDIIFLSEDGLRSLGRVIQEKSLPMRDLSANVRDDLVHDVRGHPLKDIKSIYSEDNAFYLLLLPAYKKVYCFDTRRTLQNGALRTTIWDNQLQGAMLSLPNKIYLVGSYGLAEYKGYTDNNENYYLKYYTNYFDLGNPNQLKSVKKLGATVIGGSGQDFILKVGFDYEDAYRSFPSQLQITDSAEYGVAEYNVAEYSLGTVSSGPIKLPVGGSGSVLQIGFEAALSGNEISIQKIDVYAKQGRIV